MATQEKRVTQENFDQIHTGTFAVDLANYRSILLKYEKEVKESGFDSKRAEFILGEVTGMQELVFDRMAKAGRDARKLGVPPEQIEQTLQIYRRTLAAAAVQWALRHQYIFGREVEPFLAVVQSSGDLFPPEGRRIAHEIRAARLMLDQILRTPDTAFMILPMLAKSMPGIEAGWKALGWSTNSAAASTTPPPVPPAPPATNGPGDGGDLPRRVERLESKVDKMADDVSGIKTTLVRMEELLKHSAMKADVSRIDERLSHIPTKAQMYLAGGAALATVLGVMAKGFGWL